LLAVAGTADMREIVEHAGGGDADARLAIELFVRRAAAGIAAAATALPALDALVFTGGIGEHAGSVREAIVGRLGVLRMAGVLTIEAREDLVIAADTAALVPNR
jgi:acetate kinase